MFFTTTFFLCFLALESDSIGNYAIHVILYHVIFEILIHNTRYPTFRRENRV